MATTKITEETSNEQKITNALGGDTTGYTSKYDVSGAISNLQNSGGEFTYDPLTDAAYQAYAKEYGRLGEKALQNTLGQAAASTGGRASSYAVTAAAQAQNDYNRQLTAMIPELQEAAYSKWADQYERNLQYANLLMDADSADYTRYADERDFNYQQTRDNVADSQWEQEFVYQQNRDAVSDQQWEQEFAETVKNNTRNYELSEKELELEKEEFEENVRQFGLTYALEKLETELAVKESKANIKNTNADTAYTKKQTKLLGKASGSSSSSSGSSSSGGGSKTVSSKSSSSTSSTSSSGSKSSSKTSTKSNGTKASVKTINATLASMEKSMGHNDSSKFSMTAYLKNQGYSQKQIAKVLKTYGYN